MPKPELEFFDTNEIPWKKAKEFDKAWVKILSEDPDFKFFNLFEISKVAVPEHVTLI